MPWQHEHYAGGKGFRPLADTERALLAEHSPTGHALTGALAVVTDGAGRVLLGRLTRGMWELPGGKTASTGSRTRPGRPLTQFVPLAGIAAVRDSVGEAGQFYSLPPSAVRTAGMV
ncbi:hypothetical protein [Streptomyces sp. NPDC006510]|uniref:NUDIX hydrolase n=1 Tax=Streptomyces sp. NPDC006510 TaxID=3155600 RepID=UPI0033ACA920